MKARQIILIGLMIQLISCAGHHSLFVGGNDSEKSIESSQMIIVVTKDWKSHKGSLRRFERQGAKHGWKPLGNDIPVVVGRNGLGWGKGLHDTPDDGNPVKQEGDGKAPAGAFLLSSVFGYVKTVKNIKMKYIPLNRNIECVDDAKSKHYNRIVDRKKVKKTDWKSSEKMRRRDRLYRWGITVDHNMQNTAPGDGSCIFMHVCADPVMVRLVVLR